MQTHTHTSVGNRKEIHYRQSESFNRLIIDSTFEIYGTSMCILMAEFLFISELFNMLDPTIGY